jgi:FkbM family methyltransferase
VLRYVKRSIELHFPEIATGYREARDDRAFRRSRLQETRHGFRLAGSDLMVSDAFEPEEIAFIRDTLQQADVFVDVGANIGLYACLARSMGKHVVAVEPLRRNLDYLYANLEANGWDDVEVFPVGLASAPGTAALYGGGTGASLLSEWAGMSRLWRQTIPLSSLDILLGERFAGRRLVLKVDVEGAEYGVLQGAARTLAMSPRPVWLVEICLTEHHPQGINPHFEDAFCRFWSEGYTARTVGGGQSRVVMPADVERWVSSRSRDFGHVNYAFGKA